MKSLVVFWTLICLIGCTSTKQSTMTPQQKREADQRSTVKQGSVIGATAGAGIGLIAGVGLTVLVAALSKDRRQVDRCAALIVPMAVAGGMIGYGKGKEWGKRVARKKAEYANTEEYLLANLADARNLRVKAQAEAARLGKNMQELTLQTNTVSEQYRQGKASKNKMATQKNTVSNAQNEVKQRIQRLSEEIAGQQAVVSESTGNNKYTATRQAIEAEIVKLTKARQEFQQINSQMTQLSEKVGI